MKKGKGKGKLHINNIYLGTVFYAKLFKKKINIFHYSVVLEYCNFSVQTNFQIVCALGCLYEYFYQHILT